MLFDVAGDLGFERSPDFDDLADVPDLVLAVAVGFDLSGNGGGVASFGRVVFDFVEAVVFGDDFGEVLVVDGLLDFEAGFAVARLSGRVFDLPGSRVSRKLVSIFDLVPPDGLAAVAGSEVTRPPGACSADSIASFDNSGLAGSLATISGALRAFHQASTLGFNSEKAMMHPKTISLPMNFFRCSAAARSDGD